MQPEFTDANMRLHPVGDAMGEPEAAGVPSYASRSAAGQYRTTPLKGVWQHAPYFHNGSAATLDDVVNTYNTRQSLGLGARGGRQERTPISAVTGRLVRLVLMRYCMRHRLRRPGYWSRRLKHLGK